MDNHAWTCLDRSMHILADSEPYCATAVIQAKEEATN